MNNADTIVMFLVATLLGFLIGLDREQKREQNGSIFAGIRTFPLIALWGAINGALSQTTELSTLGLGLILTSLIALASLLLLAYWRSSSGKKIGGTTEIAALVTFGLGIFAGLGHTVIALAGAVIATTILSLRLELRRLSMALSHEDLFALVQFATVSLVVLPVVPDAAFGPWQVWNPRTIWWLVVLISAVSFVGYVSNKLIGAQKGIALTGLLGGMVSSTAVTLSFSAKSKQEPGMHRLLAAAVLAASAVMVPRVMILLSVVQVPLFRATLMPLSVFFVVSMVGFLVAYRRSAMTAVNTELSNPFRLQVALQFAFIFALILLITKAAEVYFGNQGVYVASVLAGTTKLDAIALTLGQNMASGLSLDVATKAVVLAVASNSLFKAGLALWLGNRAFARYIVVTMLLATLASSLVAWFVPAFGA